MTTIKQTFYQLRVELRKVPLLFLPCVNDLQNASKILYPIMFADDTNLLFS